MRGVQINGQAEKNFKDLFCTHRNCMSLQQHFLLRSGLYAVKYTHFIAQFDEFQKISIPVQPVFLARDRIFPSSQKVPSAPSWSALLVPARGNCRFYFFHRRLVPPILELLVRAVMEYLSVSSFLCTPCFSLHPYCYLHEQFAFSFCFVPCVAE